MPGHCLFQSHKTQGFCVADFATLSDGRRSRSKIFPLFIWIKEPCVRKFEGLERSKHLGISQTIFLYSTRNAMVYVHLVIWPQLSKQGKLRLEINQNLAQGQ